MAKGNVSFSFTAADLDRAVLEDLCMNRSLTRVYYEIREVEIEDP